MSTRPIELLDDLLGTVLLLLSLAYGIALELTRRRVLTIQQLAFALASSIGILAVGGLVEHHITNEVLDMALFGSYVQSSIVFQLKYAPLISAFVMTIAVIVHFSICSCTCCCVASPDDDASHQACTVLRLRQSATMFILAWCALYFAIGMRLNARIRLSAIKPVGGTLHWQALQCPLVLSMVHIGSLLLVLLKQMLDHTTTPSSPPLEHNPQTTTTIIKEDKLPRSPRLKSASPRHRATPKEKPSTATAVHSLHIETKPVFTPASSPNKVDSGKVSPKVRPKLAVVTTLEPTTRAKAKPALATKASVQKPVGDGYDLEGLRPRAKSAIPSTIASDSDQSRGDAIPTGRSRAKPAAISAIRTTGSDIEPPGVRAKAKSAFLRPRTAESEDDRGRSRSDMLTGRRDGDDLSGFMSSESERDEMLFGPLSTRKYNSEAVDFSHIQAYPSDPWVLCYDEATGAQYYYCQETGESRWEKPVYLCTMCEAL
ncbi:hypothetical protein THRCLA_09805 [Thraustotheca clavata]|uniref:WW domain-containing protein n=1 Tax=Thraustotheca clavata TaxID=74557 RepID=A0A1V9YUB3_9STRA|nr:hypothetical protein THRCLA_09805 [Thraustotheca clavata]